MSNSKYRNNLPQLSGDLFVTDGGLETVLVFQKQIDIAEFAAIDLMRRPDGRQIFVDYCAPYLDIAKQAGSGLVVETLTWRSSPDWAPKIGFENLDVMRLAILESVQLLAKLRDAHERETGLPMVVSGCIGPRGDGYDPGQLMTVAEATSYHAWLINVLADTPVDCVSAITMTNADEATGFTAAAMQASMPAVVSFTVETDGHLPTGQRLADAIAEVDARTDSYPAYYMINCAHPSHFTDVLADGGSWLQRVRGIRANASKCSHAELDNAEVLDDGNPHELGQEIAAIRRVLPHINVIGGCCGTGHRHIGAMATACSSSQRAA